MKFLDVFWGNGFGIVLVEQEHEGIKAYAKSIQGHDGKFGSSEVMDIKSIMDWGNTFPLDAAKALFPDHFKETNNG